jgi:hypothetical protein
MAQGDEKEEMKTPHVPARLVDSVRSMVSPAAALALDALDLRRDSSWTVDRASLRQILEERRLPADPAVLDLEEAAGGVEIQEGVMFGVFASIRRLERCPPPAKSGPAWRPGQGAQVDPAKFWSRGGETLLPLTVDVDPELWLEPSGRLALVTPIDDFGYLSPAFDGLAQLLEVIAMVEHPVFFPDEPRRFEDRLRLDGFAGESLAEALGAWEFDPAAGEHMRAFRREGLWILEQHIPGFAEDTKVGVEDPAEAPAVLREALGRTSDLTWWTPGVALPVERRAPRAPEAAGTPRRPRPHPVRVGRPAVL